VIGAYVGKGGDVANAGREVMLRLEDVQTFYGPIQALKGISLEVREGEIVTLIGANAAGKSTTLRSINGLNPPREGKIHFQGKDITSRAPHETGRIALADDAKKLRENEQVQKTYLGIER
jgi:branched-chain amino acid transport system ATP-binding protein